MLLDCDAGRINYFIDGVKYGKHILNGFNADGCGSGGAGRGHQVAQMEVALVAIQLMVLLDQKHYGMSLACNHFNPFLPQCAFGARFVFDHTYLPQ